MTTCRTLISLTLCCAFACATGVDVTDGELAAILAESNGGTSATPIGQSGNGGTSAAPIGQSGNGGTSAAPIGQGGNGGTSPSTTGGSGGASPPIMMGGGCAAPPPPASGGCATDTAISVLYTDRSDAPTFNQLTMTLSVENTGADFPLTDLVIRYWFAADGQTEFVSEIDYAQIGKDNVCVSFGNQLGQSFADIGFSASATIGEGVQDIQLRLHTPNYAQQDQANDFSFIAGATSVANENITVYQSGTRVAGCEPD